MVLRGDRTRYCEPNRLALFRVFNLSTRIKDTPKMAEMAREELKSMGPMSKAEWILALDFILLLFLWTVGDLVFHIPATISAFYRFSNFYY